MKIGSWSYIPRRAAEILRTEGAFSLWCKVLAMIGYRRVLVVERAIPPSVDGVTSDVPVTTGPLAPEDVADYLAFRPELDADDVRRRVRDGHQCFAARHEGKIVHANWVITGRAHVEFLGRDLELPPDAIYAGESYTASSFRGHNIAAVRSAHMMRHYYAAGYRRSISVVFPESRPACRAVEKAGYRPVAIMGRIKLGPWRWDFYRPFAPGASWKNG